MFRAAAPPLSVLPFAALCFAQTFLEEKKSIVSMGSWEENPCLLEGKRSLLRVGIFAAPQCRAQHPRAAVFSLLSTVPVFPALRPRSLFQAKQVAI